VRTAGPRDAIRPRYAQRAAFSARGAAGHAPPLLLLVLLLQPQPLPLQRQSLRCAPAQDKFEQRKQDRRTKSSNSTTAARQKQQQRRRRPTRC
jgi:hypothetical protein